ncbi:flavin reductase family protein [Amycolatopsis echigonensis]|uniref:Flavin reductase (DIM6/NTAB) family NADH-FMN oxidoreductase RutF n=1 Tax=Amycolatopsis echigonensis TaxID=2576905 RepID=A0A2N3WPH0_9PSEU|nr:MULTISPECIES: flavin reductase family protein [Amycolatopsis]MBB2502023.1 flavin reductase family protein [Amycolatopsis echigonensis]PKV95768.1 flavin reductase (DIM6/NTAB) family NADH-FMN oxidoreductase RutF [Amycolatopsis niigatensis]
MSEFDAVAFRTALSRFTTGVVVVTAPGPVGMVVSSFTSVSLEPPLVLFCAGNGSSTWPRIRESSRFCANVLASGQEPLARQFAGPGDRFDGVGYQPGPHGSPVLDGVHAYVDCEIAGEYPGGDHTIVVGRVLGLDTGHGTGPLVFHHSRFHDGALLNLV